MTIEHEHVAEGFDKWHLNRDGAQPWPFAPVLHHITVADHGPPHSHPWTWERHILRGWYVEEVFLEHADGGVQMAWRDKIRTGHSDLHLPPEFIHRIVEVSPGGCWTLCMYGPKVADVRHYEAA